MSMARTLPFSKESLTAAVASNTTLKGALQTLGLSIRSNNYVTIKKYISIFGCDTSHFKGCTHGGYARIALSDILVQNSGYLSTKRLKSRLFQAGLLNNECALCHLGPVWMGAPIVLQIDHVNGDPTDNRLENLRILCPNCHAQTPTFRGKNRKPVQWNKLATPTAQPKVPRNLCECGKGISRSSTKCVTCRDGTSWPPPGQVLEDVLRTSYVAVGAKIGVSDNAVKKFLRRTIGHAPRKLRRTHK